MANDKVFLPQVFAWLPSHSLLVFDLGYFAFPFFDHLTDVGSGFVTRLRAKTSYRVEKVLLDGPHVRDLIVHLGNYRAWPSTHPVRLVEVQVDGRWRRYLTNVLDPQVLSGVDVIELYGYRWHIETAFLLVKRLLDLAYLWVGSLNGIQLQVWATWLFYAILIDLCDDVAEVLQLPLSDISVEMVYRGLYHYVHAATQGYTGTPQAFLANEAESLDIVKRKRRRKRPSAVAQVRLALREDNPDGPT